MLFSSICSDSQHYFEDFSRNAFDFMFTTAESDLRIENISSLERIKLEPIYLVSERRGIELHSAFSYLSLLTCILL
jgi:hypothetical protein